MSTTSVQYAFIYFLVRISGYSSILFFYRSKIRDYRIFEEPGSIVLTRKTAHLLVILAKSVRKNVRRRFVRLKYFAISGCYFRDKDTAVAGGPRRNTRKFRFIRLMHFAGVCGAGSYESEWSKHGVALVAVANVLEYMPPVLIGRRNLESLCILRWLYVGASGIPWAKNDSISRGCVSFIAMSISRWAVVAAVFWRKHPTLYSDNEISREHEGGLFPSFRCCNRALMEVVHATATEFYSIFAAANFYACRGQDKIGFLLLRFVWKHITGRLLPLKNKTHGLFLCFSFIVLCIYVTFFFNGTLYLSLFLFLLIRDT